MQKIFQTIFINNKKYQVNTKGKSEFGKIQIGQNLYEIISVNSKTKKPFEIITSLYEADFSDIEIKIKDVKTNEKMELPKELGLAFEIYQILLYFWYIYEGKKLPVYYNKQKIKAPSVENKIRLKEHLSYFVHQIYYNGSIFDCICKLLKGDTEEIQISGLLLNHNKGIASFIILKEKKYALRAISAYLCEIIDICPSYVFDMEEFLVLKEEDLKELSKTVPYDKTKKYTNKLQPTLKEAIVQ